MNRGPSCFCSYHRHMRTLLLAVLVGAAGCSSSSGQEALDFKVTWSFEAGDCAANAVETVRVTWGRSGQAPTDARLDCTSADALLGEFSAEPASYAVSVAGLDAAKVERFVGGATLDVGARGTFGRPVDIALRPKPAQLTVNWNGCPRDVVLPYFVAILDTPSTTDQGAAKLTEAQASCAANTVSFGAVPPGRFVVDLATRALTPDVQARKPITLVAGEQFTVEFDL